MIEKYVKKLEEKNKEQQKEIERLNKENEELKKIQCTFLGTGCKAEMERLIISLQAQEELTMNEHIKIERLNNIINKIIEFLQREQIEKGEYSDFFIENKQIKVQEVLDKLQELKGDDKK